MNRLVPLLRAGLRSNFGLSVARHRLLVEKKDRWLVPVFGVAALGLLPLIYGLAFMILQPVLPIFLVDEIHVQYSQAAMARGLIFYGTIALLSPWFGRLLDTWNAVRLSILGFALLIFFPLALALSRSVAATICRRQIPRGQEPKPRCAAPPFGLDNPIAAV